MALKIEIVFGITDPFIHIEHTFRQKMIEILLVRKLSLGLLLEIVVKKITA